MKPLGLDLVDVPFAHSWALVRASGVVACGGDLSWRRPLASVTKVIAAWSTLVAVQRGLTSLDAPAGPRGSTVRHLLAHASGLPAEAATAQVPPGTRRIYSNAGFDLLGVHLAEVTGTDASRWIEESVVEPLGMSGATVEGSLAHSGVASVEDLVLLASELLHPTLLVPELSAEAVRVQFPDLAGVVPGYGRHTPCPWGLGVEIRGDKVPHWTAPGASPATFGHFGVSGSFIWVDRERGAAAVFLGEESFGPWHKENWATFNQGLLDSVDAA